MHRIFPEYFDKNDADGWDGWNYDWAVGTTGSKWFPTIHYVDEGNPTVLGYETAWTPNNGTLQRLSEITGWEIENEYEEPNMEFE